MSQNENDELNGMLKASEDDLGKVPMGTRCDESPSEAEPSKKELADQLARHYVQWATHDDRIFIPAAQTRKELIPGAYEIGTNPSIGLYFEKIPVKTEGLVRFPDTNSDRVIEEIQKFWGRRERFDQYKLSYKRGILLWGPPGGGKSCTIQFIMADVITRGGIVLKFEEPRMFIDGLRVLRCIQPMTPVVATMEDVDSILEQHNESRVLNILDGLNETNGVVFLATTNYPRKLGGRIVNRPSRFDKRFKIGYPNAECRRVYFRHIIGNEEIRRLHIDLNRWVEDTDNLSIAHLKELFICVVILGDDYNEAIQTLQTMKEEIDDKEYDGNFGFSKKDQPRRLR